MNKERGPRAYYSLLLLLAAFIWGMAFVSQSKGMDYMGPLTFNGVRSLIGAGVLALYLLAAGRLRRENRARSDWKKTLFAGVCCGFALTAASTLQQFGILYTTVGKAGFITTLYIVFVPLGGVFLRKKIQKIFWLAAVLAAAGMYLLCMTESFVPGMGDIYVFLCAVAFTVHILLVDHFSPETDNVMVSCIQFGVCGVICTAGALFWEQPTFAQLWEGAGALAYAGVMSCGVAYTLQIVGQRSVNPTAAALILSLESVFAAVSGWIAYEIGFLKTDQTMNGRQMIGCALVFAAVILVQLPLERFSSGRRKRPDS